MKVLDTEFARDFIRMCNDGWTFGWHEANGGNASYRMRPEEVAEVRTGFRTRPWVRIEAEIPTLAGEFFLITAAGSHFRNITHDPKRTLGIIEIDRTGTCWRECWGFKDGTHPTSELMSHLINHEVRKAATHGASRVIYHCHPASLAAMTCVVPHDSAVFTRTLWAQLAECALICREGVEVIGWEVPGSVDLAIESAKAMEHTSVVIWPHHGLFVAADDMDEAFGKAHTVEKAADIFCKAHACGLPGVSQITDQDLVRFSREYDLGLARRNVYAKPYGGAERPKASSARNAANDQPAAVPMEEILRLPGAFSLPVASSAAQVVEPEAAPTPSQSRPEPMPVQPQPEPAPMSTQPQPESASVPVQPMFEQPRPESVQPAFEQPQPQPAQPQSMQPNMQPQPQPHVASSQPAGAQPVYRFYPKARSRTS